MFNFVTCFIELFDICGRKNYIAVFKLSKTKELSAEEELFLRSLLFCYSYIVLY